MNLSDYQYFLLFYYFYYWLFCKKLAIIINFYCINNHFSSSAKNCLSWSIIIFLKLISFHIILIIPYFLKFEELLKTFVIDLTLNYWFFYFLNILIMQKRLACCFSYKILIISHCFFYCIYNVDIILSFLKKK